MQALTASNCELQEAYKEKSRKCRNWEKMCKALKAQPQAVHRQYPSPSGSTASVSIMNASMHAPSHQGHTASHQGSTIGVASPFGRMIARPVMRPSYQPSGAVTTHSMHAQPSSMMRPHNQVMMRPDTPGHVKRPAIGVFDRFQRPQVPVMAQRPVVQAVPTSRQRIIRPKTPLQLTQRAGFIAKRPNFQM